MLGKSGVFRADDLFDRHADGQGLCRVGFEPDLHPLDNDGHDEFEYEQIIVWDHFEEGEHDLRHIAHIEEYGTPMPQRRHDPDQLVVETVRGHRVSLVEVFECWVHSSTQETLESFLIQRQFQKILPS